MHSSTRHVLLCHIQHRKNSSWRLHSDPMHKQICHGKMSSASDVTVPAASERAPRPTWPRVLGSDPSENPSLLLTSALPDPQQGLVSTHLECDASFAPCRMLSLRCLQARCVTKERHGLAQNVASRFEQCKTDLKQQPPAASKRGTLFEHAANHLTLSRQAHERAATQLLQVYMSPPPFKE